MAFRKIIVFCGVLLLMGCSQQPQSTDSAETIKALEQQWSDAAGAKNIDWIMDHHWDDARQMASGAPAIVGADAVRAAWVEMLETQDLHLEWSSDFAKVSGDLAYDYGRGVITAPDGTTTNAKYVVVWERRDGEWKVIVDMFSPDE